MNTLKKSLESRGLTLTEASLKGIPLTTIVKHCRGERGIGVSAALRYEKLLGIPRSELRPDLWPAGGPGTNKQTPARGVAEE